MLSGIRARTTVVAATLVLLVLAVAGFALVTAQRAVLTDSVDEVLGRRADAVIAAIEGTPSPDGGGVVAVALPGDGDEESWAVVVDASGTAVASTERGSRGIRLPAAPDDSIVFSVVRAPNGEEFRVRSERAGDLVVHTGTPLDDVNDSVDALVRGLAVSVPLTTLLLAAGVWFLVGRVLRPVEAIRSEVADIRGETLDRRVPEPATHDEIARLAATMNEMLDRIERASTEQRRFVVDASHELRSPLARMRAELEVDLAHPELADAAGTQERIRADLIALQRLVDDLLALAAIDEGTPSTASRSVDLDDVVFREVASLRATRPGLAIDTSGVTAARVLGRATQLSRVVANLLENAATHGSPPILVRLSEQDGSAMLTVTDAGRGIRPEDADRIFDRFVRLDDARTPERSGVGLGLAIVRTVVEAHGGSIALDTDVDQGTRFVVRLPLAPH
jgi:signal transduction histidine kinase